MSQIDFENQQLKCLGLAVEVLKSAEALENSIAGGNIGSNDEIALAEDLIWKAKDLKNELRFRRRIEEIIRDEWEDQKDE